MLSICKTQKITFCVCKEVPDLRTNIYVGFNIYVASSGMTAMAKVVNNGIIAEISARNLLFLQG